MIYKSIKYFLARRLLMCSQEILNHHRSKKRSVRNKRGGKRGLRGLHKKDYWSTPWARTLLDLCQAANRGDALALTRKGKLFRRRFRVPFPVFLHLVYMCKEDSIFGPLSNNDVDICG